MTYTDEQLSTFLDGELLDTEMRAIEDAIHSDPALAERLEHLANVDVQLRQTFEPVLDEPLPDAVLALLNEVEDQTYSNVVSFVAEKKSRGIWQLPVAIAASLMVGYFAPQAFNQGAKGDAEFIVTGPVPHESQLYVALSSVVSSQNLGDIEPVLSFRSTGGEYCREFTTSHSRGLACQNGQTWNVVLQVYLSNVSSNNGYATAGSQSFEAFDALIDNLIAGETLNQSQEKDLIKLKWEFDGK